MSGNRPSLPPVLANERRLFQIHGCLGRGGFGEVYRATMESATGVTTEVAVKVLRADISIGGEAVKRLRDEGRLLGKLSHPSILKVHDLVLLDNRVALVTEYVEGEDLDTCIRGNPPIPLRPLILAVGEVAAALDAAWRSPAPSTGMPLHLIHRDVKPANVRIGRHGEVKLLDFGIARATNVVREAETAHDAMMGSFPYMAPERFLEEEIEPPSDVFSLGCILFEGIVGQRFYEGATLKQVYGTVLNPSRFERLRAERLALVRPRVPAEVADLVERVMHSDPDERPDAGELAHMCEDLAEDLPGPTLKRWCRERGWTEPEPIQGSLDGKALTAGSFLDSTLKPAPVREASPGALGPIPSAPPPPAPDFRAATPRPAPVATGRSDGSGPSLGALGGLGLQQEPSFEMPGPMTSAPPHDPRHLSAEIGLSPMPLPPRRRRTSAVMIASGVVLALALLVVVPASYFAARAFTRAAQPVAADGLVVDGTPDPVAPEEDGEEAEPAAADAEPVGEDRPQPVEAPAPVEPAPVEPAAPTAASLSARGWDTVSSDADGAAELFRQALALTPGHADAEYGLGYVLLQQGRTNDARPHLCAAAANGGSDIRRDVRSLLGRNSLSCE